MKRVDEDVWVAEQPLRFGGFEVGTRMTVIRLPGDRLFIHSPIRLDGARAELERIGRPRYVVAPNRLHHLFAAEYCTAYPEVELFVAPTLDKKRPDLRIAGVLGDGAPSGWADQIDQAVIRGYPTLNEVVFFHRASRTLLVSDLVFNIGADSPLLTRFGTWLIGGYGRFGPTFLERLFIRDRRAARASLERILTWDFDRVVLAHGNVLESGGAEELRRGYAWLLAS